MPNLESILAAISVAKTAVTAVTSLIHDGGEMLSTLSSHDEANLEQKITELEALLPELRRTTQAKLRG
jgi:hypothetical protein